MSDKGEWRASPDPKDPDNFWIDDSTGERVCAATGARTMPVARVWYALRDTGDIECLGVRKDFFEADEACTSSYVWLFDESEWLKWVSQVNQEKKAA